LPGIYEVTFTIHPGGSTDYAVSRIGSESTHTAHGVTSMSKVRGVCEYTVSVGAVSAEDALQFASSYTVMFPEAGERIVGEEEVNQSEVGASHSTVA
jgi:hypothetical protein